MFEKTFYSLSQFFGKQSGIVRSQTNTSSFQYLVDKPAWLSLIDVHDFRKAVAENPVLNGCISILANAAANGKKYLVDLKGKEVPWDSGKTGVKQARKLFIDRPNPLQSVKEFNYERAYMFFTFGNNYVYLNNPLDSYKTDIMSVQTMINLPSEWVSVRQTGRIYDQINLEGIIEKYALTNTNPVREFLPDRVIHFNDLNTSDVGNSIMGSSRLQVLKYPITNTQLAFEAMNVILKSRGMQGIIKANNKDATGTQIPLNKSAKDEIDATFKSEYGLKESQKQYLISYTDIDFIKTIMNSEELGIYKEFSNNAMIISNTFGVPPELYKTYISGATFENQVQAVRRLYQDTTIPYCENEDQYYTERLGLRDYGLELRTDFSHVQALQEAFKEKATALSMNANTAEKGYNSGIITRNQYLQLLDMEPLPDGDVTKSQWDAMNAKDSTQLLAQVIGVGGTQALTAIMTDPVLTNEQKIQLLITLFAFDETTARTIVGTENVLL
jgi:phage portal protein BeeE